MRNLKRVLSLALALVMTLSLMVVNSSAVEVTRIDFTDADEITYKEAVDVMVALGVIDGGDQGAFEPHSILTREQAAKVICYMLLGPENAENLTTNSATIFTDVASGRWSAGYISYCANLDILSGTGEGTFLPAGELTGVTFGKMLLVALGYDAAIEGYVGDNWSTAIGSDMVDAGIAISGVVMTEPLTREQAAQMAFQTLTADMVHYTQRPVTVNTSDGTSVIVNAPDATPIANSKTDDYRAVVADRDEIQQFCEKNYPRLALTTGEDDFGRPAGRWTYRGFEVGKYVIDADLTYTAEVKLSDIFKELGLAQSVDADHVEFFRNGKGEAVTTGQITDNDSDAPVNLDTLGLSKGVENKIGGNGVLTQVWFDDATRVVTISMIDTYVGKVASVTKASGSSDRSITLSTFTSPANVLTSLNTKFETENFDAKEVVTYTAAWNDSTGKYDIQTVALLDDPTTGRLTKWNGSTYGGQTGKSENSFTVDGVTYMYSANKVVVNDTGSQLVNGIADFTVNESDVDVYLDAYGYALYVAGVAGEKKYAAVIGVGEDNPYGDGSTGATLLLPDGTTVAVTYKLKNGSGNLTTPNKVHNDNGSSSNGWSADIVEYRVLDNGTYELNLLAEHDDTYDDVANEIQFVNGRSAFVLDDGADQTGEVKLYTTSETIFMVATKDGTSGRLKYDVYIGYSAMPSIDTGKVNHSIAYKTNSYYTTQIDIVYVAYDSMAGVSSVDAYIAKKADADIITDSTGSYYVLPAVVDGEVTEVKVDASIDDPIDLKGNTETGVFAITNVVKDSNGIITSFANASASLTASNGNAGTVSANGIVLGIGTSSTPETTTTDLVANATYWAYTSDTKVYYVDKDFEAIDVIDITSVGTDLNDKVYATTNSDGTQKTLKDVFVVEVEDTTAPVAPNVPPVVTTGDTYVKLDTSAGTAVLYYKYNTTEPTNTAEDLVQAALEAAGYEVTNIENNKTSGVDFTAKKGVRTIVFNWDSGDNVEAYVGTVDNKEVWIDITGNSNHPQLTNTYIENGVTMTGTFGKVITGTGLDSTPAKDNYVSVSGTGIEVTGNGFNVESGYVSLTIDGGAATYIKAGQAYTPATPANAKGTGFDLNDGTDSYLKYGSAFTPVATKNYALTSGYVTVTWQVPNGYTVKTTASDNVTFVKVAASQTLKVTVTGDAAENWTTIATVTNSVTGGGSNLTTATLTGSTSSSDKDVVLTGTADCSTASGDLTITISVISDS